MECTELCAHEVKYAPEYLHGNNPCNIDRSVVVGDTNMLVLTSTENLE